MAEAALLDADPDVIEQNSPPPAAAPAGPKRMGRPPGTLLNNELAPEDFFGQLNEMSDAEWAMSLCYVWRRDPFTDNTNGGREPKYVDVINRAVTEKDIKEEHGSGTYKLQLNRKDRYHSHTILSLEDPKYPPHIPPGDWFNHPRNKKWVTWKPLVEKWWKDKLLSLAAPTTPTPQEGGGAALGELTRLISQLAANNGKSSDGDKLQSTLVAWALQQTADEKKAEREADSPDKLTSMIRAIKELSPPPPPQDNSMMTFILGQLTRLQESNDKLIQMILTQKTNDNKVPDPLAQVETMAKLITTVSGIVQPAAPKEWYQDLAETLGPKLVDLTGQIVQINAMNARRPNPAPPAGRSVVPVTAQPAYPSPPPQSATPPPDAPPQTQEQPAAPEMDTMQLTIITNLAIEVSQALNLGLKGDQYADQFCFKHGEAMYEQLTQIPAETLLPMIKSIPVAWQHLAPFEAHLPNFIESFYSLLEQDEPDETKSISVPEPEPEPVKMAAKKSKKVK